MRSAWTLLLLSSAAAWLSGCSDDLLGASGGAGGRHGGSGVDASVPLDASVAPDGGGAGGAGEVPTLWRPQVIYMVMPDRFFNGDPSNDKSGTPGCFDPTNAQKSHGGDLVGLRQKLPYLTDLGVTAVWLTPLYRQSPDQCGYHGYFADFADPDDGALEPPLGSAADFTAFIGDAHAAGIKVILDIVVNHTGTAAKVVTQHPDWFHDPATCKMLGDPAVFCPLSKWLPDFAQEKPEVAAYLNGVSVGWVTRFAIDGIRMDTVKHVPTSYFMKSWIPAVRGARSPLFLLGEVFDEGAATNLKPFLDAGFDSLFNYPLRLALVNTFTSGGSVDSVASKLAEEISTFGLPTTLMLTTFVDNHDNPRFTSLTPAGTSEAEVRRRFHLALGALFTLPGVPQLYYGDELAMYGAQDPDNRRDMPSFAWSSTDRAGTYPGQAPPNPELTYTQVQKLIGIRKSNPALSEGSYVEMWRQNGGAANVLAFFRGSGASRVVVALNNGAQGSGPVNVQVENNHGLEAGDHAALADGTVLTDLLGSGAPKTVTVAKGILLIDLPPKTIGIYKVP